MTAASTRYLVFSLSGEQYAIPLLKVKEVIAHSDITPVPQTPPHFKGIMNLRGQVISIVDLKSKFKMPRMDRSQESSIIILDLAPYSLGMIVDSIDSVLPFEPHEISPAPDIESQVSADYITGVATHDKKLVLVLDIARALSLEELKATLSPKSQAA